MSAPSGRASARVLESQCRGVEASLPEAYATLSGDHNPIHLSDIAAARAGLPRRVLHGMVTAAWCLDALQAASPLPLAAFACRFVQPAHPGDALRFKPRAHDAAWTCDATSEAGASLLKNVTASARLEGRALLAPSVLDPALTLGSELDPEPGITARYACLLGLKSAHVAAWMGEVVRVGPTVLATAERVGLAVEGAVHVGLELELGRDPTPDRRLRVQVAVDDDKLRGGLRRVVVSAHWGAHDAAHFDARGRWTLVSR